MKKLIFAGLLSMLLPKQVVAQTFKEVDYAPQETKFQLFAPNGANQITVRI
jgi:pullulanase